MAEAENRIDKIISLSSRRGIFFQTSDIYGAVAGFYDYGPVGVQIKRNVENSWWNHFVNSREDVVGIDGAIISNPNVWRASGHVDVFHDPLVACRKCGNRIRADHLIEDELKIAADGMSLEKMASLISEKKIKCQKCKGELTEPRVFNLMFKTHIGPVEDEKSEAYLRPETAQLIFPNFKNVMQTSRQKLPFGIAQMGKAFRNEISPRNFVFRLREFSQMEIEFFIDPKKMDGVELPEGMLSFEVSVLTADAQEKNGDAKSFSFKDLLEKKLIKTKWHAYWLFDYLQWLTSIGIKKENLRLRQHVKTELSHYSSETWDIEYNFPWGYKELMGIANRGDFDLSQHQKFSKEDLTYFEESSKERFLPYVIEPSIGLERLIITLLLDAYLEKEEKGEKKTVLKLHPSIAPVQVAVFPLMKKDGLAEKGHEVFKTLQKDFIALYDESGSIGKRYARVDEIGCPIALTIDYDTLKDGTVTIRERDSGSQRREKIENLTLELSKLFKC